MNAPRKFGAMMRGAPREPMTFLERLGLKRLASVPGQERPVFRKLELHVAHGCNLSCESCSHYSNHAHAGIVSLEDADRWMGLWSGRRIGHAILAAWRRTHHPSGAAASRWRGAKHWPRTKIEIVSNGFFHPCRRPDARLVISVHHMAEEYQPVFALLREWRRDHGVVAACAQELDPALRRLRRHDAAI
ncbi:death domain-containing protein [Mesorhizobium waimense]|uniref:death domain-containing protein n=1 Tax=Mesorhizobium waimense TaxID=1300307 RepID=UPI001ABFC53C|nr:death domain-containing protein [Mesorhizobium waimense]